MTPQVAIIGCGTLTEQFYIPALKQLGIQTIYLNDLNPGRAHQLARQHRLHTFSIDSIPSSCETVIVATPPHAHYELVKYALQNRKHVICEKPFTTDYATAMELADLSDKVNKELYVAHIRRIYGGITLAKELVRQGSYGILLNVEMYEGSRFNYRSVSGYVKTDPHGGVLPDTGSHVLDAFLYITGLDRKPVSIHTIVTQKERSEPSHFFEADFILKDDTNEFPVRLILSRYEALSNKINLRFEKGILEVPLSMKPFVRFRSNGESEVISSPHPSAQYVSEAFREELYAMLAEKNTDTFGVKRFLNLSYLLDSLYHA